MTNNNLSVLPFYDNINEQDWRKSYSYGDVYPLYSQAGYLLPFQIVRPHREGGIVSATLHKKDGTLVRSIRNEMVDAGLMIVPFTAYGYDVILYPAIFPLQFTQEGQFYVSLNDGTQQWYSEVFTSVREMGGFLKMEWYNDDNVVYAGGQFVFKNPRFHNFLYFATEVGKPDYTFEEEGESRDGYFFPSKQLSEKRYKFTFLAPEYLCDTMRIVRMCDHVRITDKYGRNYDCDTFLITPEWQEQGNLAKVVAEFETDTVIKKIGQGYTIPQAGDFNTDYNDDYLINP